MVLLESDVDFEGDVEALVIRLQAHLAHRPDAAVRISDREYAHDDTYYKYEIVYYRDENDDEYTRRLTAEKERDDKQVEWDRKQYEALKKKFGE